MVEVSFLMELDFFGSRTKHILCKHVVYVCRALVRSRTWCRAVLDFGALLRSLMLSVLWWECAFVVCVVSVLFTPALLTSVTPKSVTGDTEQQIRWEGGRECLPRI